MINVALPKGRLGEIVYGMMEQAGYECPEVLNPKRKLTFENEERGVRNLRFDLRAYSVSGVRGIRIRYSGIAFNPFRFSPGMGIIADDKYMGVRMIKKIVEIVNYQRAFGVNTLQIILKEDKKNEA